MIAGLAQRLRCTEGQLYTMVIGVVFAALLATAGLPAAFRDVVSPPLRAAAEVPSTTTTTVPSDTSLVDVVGDPSSPYYNPDSPLLDDPLTSDTPAGGDDELPPVDGPAAACSSQATLDATSKLLHSLDGLGVLPSDATMNLLASVTKCKPSDNTVLALGVLAEFGGKLPHPPLTLPLLPIPSLELPAALIEQAQPLRDAFDPICGAVGQLPTLVFYGLGPFPIGVGPFTLQAINQILFVCGQLQEPKS